MELIERSHQKQRINSIIDSKDGDSILLIDGDTITLDIPLTVQNMSSFLQGTKLRYNNGNGTRDVVSFIGVDFINGMQLKCNIILLMIPLNLLILKL